MNTTSITNHKHFRYICYLLLFICFFMMGELKAYDKEERADCISELSYYIAEYEAVLDDKGFIENGSVISNSDAVVYGKPLVVAVADQPTPEAQAQPEISRGLPRSITNTLTQPTGMTADEFNTLINSIAPADSQLIGLGDTIVEFENTYKLNGIYAIAITVESGYGVSDAAYSRNNLIGAMRPEGGQKYYDSPSDCIMDLGDILMSGYVNSGRTTLTSISKKYCPPNPEHWVSLVNSGVQKLITVSNQE